MNDITRCPNCQTAFRVTEAQLQAHRGKVRCGRCAFVFNANECLEQEQKVEALSEIAAPSPVKETEATEIIEVREVSESIPSAVQIMPLAAAESLVPEPFEPAQPTLAEPTEPPPHFAINAPVPPTIAEHRVPPPSSRPKRIVLDSDEPTLDASIGLAPISEPVLEPEMAPEQPKPPVKASLEAPQGYHPILSEADDALLAAPPERSKWQGLLIALSIILMLSFAAQLAYQQRTNISMEFPWLRPKLILACQTLGCSMPLPKNAELLRSEWSELSYVPEFPSIIQLNATLRNLAQYEQALPLLEVTLTDDQERIVLKKVFKPSEYLNQHDKKRSKFDAQDDLRAFLQIDLGELHSTAYSIYWFYP